MVFIRRLGQSSRDVSLNNTGVGDGSLNSGGGVPA